MKIIPKYLSSMNWCQNTVNYLISVTILEVDASQGS